VLGRQHIDDPGTRVEEQIPDLGPGARSRIMEAALAANHAESGPVRLLMCDKCQAVSTRG
jgi:hypothetical protein